MQARVLRTIDKVGGLDEYLLGGKASRIKELGMGGWALRWRLLQTESVKERFRRERERLGVPEGGLQALMERMMVKEEGKVVLEGKDGEDLRRHADEEVEEVHENPDGSYIIQPPEVEQSRTDERRA